MLPNIELSPRALIEVRIKALEAMYSNVYKTIDYANKRLLEYELGNAYKELVLFIKPVSHDNNSNKKNSKANNNTSYLKKTSTRKIRVG